MALDLPQTFGKYVLQRKLAVGGMAEVFLAKAMGAEGFQRTVVIKRILPSYSEDEAFVSMFIDEARIAAELHHAAIVQTIDFDKVDDAFYIAMEYIEGHDLRKIIDRGTAVDRALTPLMAAHSTAQIASGLHYAHTRKNEEDEPLNIIHRDVSPHNIMISIGGDVKLTDFGIAKAAARSTKTRAGTVKGKCAYMSPEQAKGKPLDPRSDVFALCAVTWEMLTYRRLFEGDSDFEILNNVLNQSVPPASLFRKSVPRELDAIILKGLRKAPNERYASMAALEKDLQNFVFKHASGREELDLAAYMKSLFEDGTDDSKAPADQTPTPKKDSRKATPPRSEAGTDLISEDMEADSSSPVEPEAETLAIDVSEGSPPTTVPVGMLKDELEEVLAREEEEREKEDRPNAAPTIALPETDVKTMLTDTGEDMQSPGAGRVGSTGNLPVGTGSHTGVTARRSSRAAMWVFFLLVGVALGIGGYYGVMTFGDPSVVIPPIEEPGEDAKMATDTDPLDAGTRMEPDPGSAQLPDEGTPKAVVAGDVAGGDRVDPEEPPPAVIRLEVAPRKARVKVDGDLIPSVNGERILSGRFKVGDQFSVEARANGYQTHRSRYTVQKENEVFPLTLSRIKKQPPKPKPEPVPTETGYVTINARPWADVYYKTRRVGTTPVRRFEVPVGRHVFTLRNKVASKSITINVDKGRTTTRVVDM